VRRCSWPTRGMGKTLVPLALSTDTFDAKVLSALSQIGSASADFEHRAGVMDDLTLRYQPG
jgi:hypothetical protein